VVTENVLDTHNVWCSSTQKLFEQLDHEFRRLLADTAHLVFARFPELSSS
jgi:hypothetical protein